MGKNAAGRLTSRRFPVGSQGWKARYDGVHAAERMKGHMKRTCNILLHLLGLGCIAACLGIVVSKGALNIHWSGWIAAGFFAVLSLGILGGWFPWRGQPLRVLVKGVYTMSALALIGFGFRRDDPWRLELWMILVLLAAAILARIIVKIALHLGDDSGDDSEAPAPRPKPPAAGDPFFD